MLKMLLIFVSFFIFAINGSFVVDSWSDTCAKSKFRLSSETVPKEYWLKVVPKFNDTSQFSGAVTIKILIKKSTKNIILHSKRLNIRDVILKKGNKKISVNFNESPNDCVLIIKSTRKLLKNQIYDLQIQYNGELSMTGHGFYEFSYNHGNETRSTFITQMEPTYARMAFPCYDEPGFKTPFSIAIARNENENTRSNMPLKFTLRPSSETNGRVWDIYEKTPPMPTYLVAFMISRYRYIMDPGKKIFIWMRETLVGQGNFPLIQGKKLMSAMEEFTKIPYMLPKMDLVATRYIFGAMENYGMNTYEENLLMCDEKKCSRRYQQRVMKVIAHEFAHQWFGNYVTMAWWNNLWLKEGFATYFEYHLVTQVNPDWQMDQYFVVTAQQSALSKDESSTVHAMTKDVASPSEISTKYDIITYEKGGSVIRMLQHIVSYSTFQKALIRFLTQGFKKGGSVVDVDLWNAFEEQINKDKVKIGLPSDESITSVMKKWVENPGFPVIKVGIKKNRLFQHIRVTQEPYINYNGSSKWIIPLTFTTKSALNFKNTMQKIWSTSGKETIVRFSIKKNEWILFNIQQTGYYRVNYDLRNWNLLIRQLHEDLTKIHRLNRAQLIDDSFSLGLANKTKLDVPFALTTYIEDEKDAVPWFTAISRFYRTYNLFQGKSRELFLEYFLTCLEHQYRRIGFKKSSKDSHLTIILRSSILEIACYFNVSDCIENARQEYAKNKNDLSKIDPELQFIVFCMELKYNTVDSVYSILYKLYLQTNIICEKQSIIRAMTTCYTKKNHLKRRLNDFITNISILQNEEWDRTFKLLFFSDDNVNVGLEVIKDMMPVLHENKINQFELKNLKFLMEYVGERIHTPEQIDFIKEMNEQTQILNEDNFDIIKSTLQRVVDEKTKAAQFNENYLKKIFKKYSCSKIK